MADSFFKLKDSLNEFDEKYHDLEEDEYDALNDETFGADATVSEDDWEDMHTRLAAATESKRGREVDFEPNDGLELEKSLNKLVLSDDVPIGAKSPSKGPSWAPFGPSPLIFDKPFQPPFQRTQPPRIMTVEEIERQMIDKEKNSPRQPAASLAPFFRNMRPGNPQMIPPPLMNRPTFPPPPAAIFPGFSQPIRPQNHPYPPAPFGPAQRPPGFMMPPLMNQPIGRPHPHPIPGKPGMGMYPPAMPPHITAQDLIMRAQLEKVGMPLIMQKPPHPRMMPPPGLVMDPRRMNFQHENQQIRHEMMYGQMTHPLLIAHLNHQKLLQQQNQQKMNRHNERDEYAKLMNNRERTWVLNIQMMMLALENPQVDDYYYYMWKKRHPAPVKPLPVKNGFHKDQKNPRERRDSENANTSQRVYVPLQYENSLGKLQAKSVNAPRMVFDVEMVNDSQTGPQAGVAHKDHRKTKKILLELERLYLLMMEAEEAELNPQNNVLKKDLVNKVVVGLLNDERFLSFLCIRKGKTLFLRCFGYVTKWDSPMFIDLWAKLLKAFPTVLRRDKDDAMLPRFYPYFREWADETTWQGILTVAKSLLAGARDGRTSIFRASPSPSKPVLSYILTNQFGISAVAKIVQQGEFLAALLLDHETVEWKSFIEELVKSMANLDPSERTTQPIEPIPHNTLTAILDKRCSNLASQLHANALKLLAS